MQYCYQNDRYKLAEYLKAFTLFSCFYLEEIFWSGFLANSKPGAVRVQVETSKLHVLADKNRRGIDSACRPFPAQCFPFRKLAGPGSGYAAGIGFVPEARSGLRCAFSKRGSRQGAVTVAAHVRRATTRLAALSLPESHRPDLPRLPASESRPSMCLPPRSGLRQ